jgi:alpha-beta hydrolase superfamily lysophospholipase
MDTHVREDSPPKTSLGIPQQPFYFKSGNSKLFAWLHCPPDLAASDIGVVICSPYGYESICARRSVRRFAEATADAGIPTLRFDYRSTGDSSDVDENADHLKIWTQDIIAAIGELRSRTGVERICLVGIRLGALLASLAAAEVRPVDFLILIWPVVNGRKYVRELRTMQLAGIAISTASEPDADPSATGTKPNTLEAGGFSFSEATLRSLGEIDLLIADAPAVRSALVIDNDKFPSAKRWAESLAESGIDVTYRAIPGLIKMTVTAPQFAAVPVVMVGAAREWLSSLRANTGRLHSSPVGKLAATWDDLSISAVMPLAENDLSPQVSITERPVFVTNDVTLFGIVTEPRSDEKRRRAVILLNAGADFHIGASRIYVNLARRWARRGYFVLRLDLAGIGDSGTRLDKADDEVFPEQAVDDIRSAIEFMQSRYAIANITLAGLCSGAYHALRAASAGLRVNRILMVNPQNYFWKKGMTLQQVQLVEAIHNPRLYRRRLLSRGAWRRFFTGQVNVWRIGVIYTHRVGLAGSDALRAFARVLRFRLPNDLGWELQNIVDRGIGVVFVFARGEPGIELLRRQAGSTLSRLGDRCRVRLVDGGDHIFSRREARSVMEAILSEELFARFAEPAAMVEGHASRALEKGSLR